MFDTTPTIDAAITRVLQKFVAGDPGMFEDIAPDINFAIEHYHDEVDVSWQRASGIAEMAAVVQRLGPEVFPKGTQALGIDTHALGGGWHMTRFEQRYHYAVRDRMVESVTFIISHEAGGKLDFFREVVTNVSDIDG